MAKLQSGTRIYGAANVDTVLYVNSSIIANSSGMYVSGQVNTATLLVSTNTATIGTGTYFVSNGNVGVGTSTPSDKLQVYGTSSVDFSGRVDSATAVDRPSFRFIHTGGSLTTQSPSAARLGLMSFAGINDTSSLTTYSFFDSYLEGVANSIANSNMRFVTMNGGTTAERIFIAGNTNVGINKANPVASLDVSGTGVFVLSAGMIAVNSGISIDYGTIADTGTIQAETQGTAFRNLVINPNGGNVGIGNSAPTHNFSVNGTTYLGGNVTANAFSANMISTTITTAATANGSTQATAYPIVTTAVQFTTVAAGTGAILPTVPAGTRLFIANDGGNNLLVYPPVGGVIDQASVNAAITVSSGGMWEGESLSTLNWTSVSPDTVAGNGVIVTQGSGIVTLAVNQAYQYTWSNTQTFSANVVFSGTANVTGNLTVTAGANVGTNTLNVGSSTKATNGYTYLTNGIKIQWFNAAVTNAAAQAITYPTAFGTNCYSITATAGPTLTGTVATTIKVNIANGTAITAKSIGTNTNWYFVAIGV